jgi:hypothetical protein
LKRKFPEMRIFQRRALGVMVNLQNAASGRDEAGGVLFNPLICGPRRSFKTTRLITVAYCLALTRRRVTVVTASRRAARAMLNTIASIPRDYAATVEDVHEQIMVLSYGDIVDQRALVADCDAVLFDDLTLIGPEKVLAIVAEIEQHGAHISHVVGAYEVQTEAERCKWRAGLSDEDAKERDRRMTFAEILA